MQMKLHRHITAPLLGEAQSADTFVNRALYMQLALHSQLGASQTTRILEELAAEHWSPRAERSCTVRNVGQYHANYHDRARTQAINKTAPHASNMNMADIIDRWPVLASLQLTAEQLVLLGAQGYIECRAAGSAHGGNWRLRFRQNKSLKSVYLGTDVAGQPVET